MNRLTTISAAIGLTLAMQASAHAQGMMAPSSSDNTMAKPQREKCFGINAVGKNDCRTATTAGPGKATKARDPGSFVDVPVGVCAKIDGGSVNAM
jgi:uncharacterized membrane protein